MRRFLDSVIEFGHPRLSSYRSVEPLEAHGENAGNRRKRLNSDISEK